ncbi:MAG: exo-beta-N-acetylmuramidase NamZ domain-containing protein [Sphingobacteriales bacterium]
MSIVRLLPVLLLFAFTTVSAQYNRGGVSYKGKTFMVGAERTDQYLNLLTGKSVAVFANQTSMAGKIHVVDLLLKNNIKVVKIFSPEHGFRGDADAGEHVTDGRDAKTGLPIISLYGDHKKPTAEDLKDVDVMIFDIQDVGVRFYTYISYLQYYLEAAIEFNKHLMILDRPNPNGYYVDGPVLERKFSSFIGMQPIPIVYGMTMGEYAKMLLGEGWFYTPPITTTSGGTFEFTVIPCNKYDHRSKYELPVNPSPNLSSMQSIYWYPSTCFFEGTVLSEGRGTDKPFQIFGHPSLPDTLFSFTPKPNLGAKEPKLNGKLCYGWNLSDSIENVVKKVNSRIQLSWLINAYKLFPDKENFFLKPSAKNPKPEDYFFNKLAGNATLMQQIKDGKSEDEIRKSWQPELQKFKEIRKKYLLYRDFE